MRVKYTLIFSKIEIFFLKINLIRHTYLVLICNKKISLKFHKKKFKV